MKELILKKYGDNYLFMYIKCDDTGKPNIKELGLYDSWINVTNATVLQEKQTELFNLLHSH
jgi:hypothetical protein